MSPPSDPIYLDFDQCQRFRIEYYPEGTTAVIAADAILRSKDYDVGHRTILEPLGQRTLRLKGIGVGWFKIMEVF